MYKQIILKSALILALVLSCSCNKYLTLYPKDGIVRDQFWQNKEQVSAAVIGMYSSLIQVDVVDKNTNKTMAETLFIWGEVRADNVSTGLFSGLDLYNLATGNILSTNKLAQWASIYRTINACNTILDFAPGVLAKDNTLTSEKLNNYLAEALTIRALMYFYLVRTFRDAPLKLKSTSSDSDLAQLTKSTDADILAQIVTDLNIAEKGAAFTYGDRASDKGRVTHYLVNALQADVYLWMENYQACIDACDKLINSNKFGLVAGDSGFYNNLFYVGNSNESIFEFQFDSQAINTFYPLFLSRQVLQAGNNILAAPGQVGNEAFIPDPQNDKNFDIRPQTDIDNSGTIIAKYVINRTIDASYAHWIVYRYADILLMKAEACAWANRQPDALALINQVRTRANAIYTTAENPDPTDPLAVSNYVLHERNREFMFEGKRWYDLLRNAKRNYPNNLSILTNAVAATVSPQFQQKLIAQFRDKNFLYLPIYFTEIQYDPNLVQNPFYK